MAGSSGADPTAGWPEREVGSTRGAPEGGGGSDHPKEGAAKLADMTGMPASEARVAMLISENKVAFGKVDSRVFFGGQ